MRSTAMTALVLAASMAVSALPAHAAQEPRSDVQLSTGEVLLDLVVTDKKGQPVSDLRRDEIEIYEDGVRQQVSSFGLVRKGPRDVRPGTGAETGSPGLLASDPAAKVNLMIIMVDRTSIEQPELKQVFEASERFINEKLAINDLVAVFVTTTRPVMIQNFTNNKTRLVDAMRVATAGTSVLLQEPVTNSRRADLTAITQVLLDGVSNLPPGTEGGDAAAAERLQSILDANANGVESYFSVLRDQIQALAIINSIVALAQAYSEVPGRKSMVLYSAGLVMNVEVKGAFNAMVSAANRANLTINTVDVAGLDASVRPARVQPRAVRPLEESENRMLVEGGESGMDRLLKPNLVNNDEGLSRIARDTGGVLVRNTNDLGRGFAAIANDLRSYYATSYEPANVALDGKFREISVKVLRKDVEVRTRRGYFAIPGGNATLLLPFEQPVLEMIAASTFQARPSDLKVAMKTERFPTAAGWRVPIALSVEGESLTAIPRNTKNTNPAARGASPTATDFEANAVALVRDAKQNVIAKLSRTTVFRAENASVDTFRSRTAPLPPFPQPLVLQPGSYAVQIGVYDPTSRKGTVIERKITLPALPASGKEALSSLVLGTDAVSVGPDDLTAATDPLVFNGQMRIVPSATGRFVKKNGDRMIAYFTFQGTPGKAYEMILHFMKGEEAVVGTPPSPLGPLDAAGRASAAPEVPLVGLEPGSYRAVLYVVPAGSKQPVAQAVTPFQVE